MLVPLVRQARTQFNTRALNTCSGYHRRQANHFRHLTIDATNGSHQLMIFVAITRVTVHLVNTIAGTTRIKPTIIKDLAHFFICSLLPSGNQKYSRNCDFCAHQHTSRAGRNCGLQRSTTRSKNCICRISIVFELSGLLVFGVVSPLAHQQFCLWGKIWSRSTISFAT